MAREFRDAAVLAVIVAALAACGDDGTSSVVDVTDTAAADSSEDTAASDAAEPGDTQEAADTAEPLDTAAGVDSAEPSDTAEAADSVAPMDTVAATDTFADPDVVGDTIEPAADTAATDFPPTLGAFDDQEMAQGTTLALPIALFDDTPDALTVVATSSDVDVVADADLVVSQDGAAWLLTIEPGVDAVGQTVVTVAVTDAANQTVSEGFRLDVNVQSTWTGIVGQGAPGDDAIRGVATDAAGTVYTAGRFFSSAANAYRGRIRAYDKHGTQLWSVNRTSPHDVHLNAIAYWPSQNWVVVASQDKNVDGSNTQYGVVAAHDAATGVEVWQDQVDFYLDTESDYTVGVEVAVDDSGSLMFVGHFKREDTAGAWEYGGWVARWDAGDLSGGVTWSQELGVGPSDTTRVSDVLLTGDGGMVMLANSSVALPMSPTPLGDMDIVLSRYASDGSLLWVTRHGTTVRDDGRALTRLADGRIAVVGSTYGLMGSTQAGARDAVVLTVGTDGTLDWAVQSGSADSDVLFAVVAMPNSDLIVAGATNTIPNVTSDAFVRRVSTKSGEIVWETILPLSGYAWASDLAVIGPDVMVIGQTGLLSNSDGFILRVSGDGVVQ